MMMNIDQHDMTIGRDLLIAGGNINILSLENYFPRATSALYILGGIIEQMTHATSNMAETLNANVHSFQELLKRKSEYSREYLLQQREITVEQGVYIISKFSKDLFQRCKRYDQVNNDIENSMGDFIVSHQSEISFYKQHVITYINGLIQFQQGADKASKALSQFAIRIDTLITETDYNPSLVHSLQTSKGHIIVCCDVLTETDLMVQRVVRLIQTFS